MKQKWKDKGVALLLLILMIVLFVTGCTFTIGTYKNHPVNENIDYEIPPAIAKAAIESGLITEKEYDKIVNPKKMIKPQ